MLTPHITRFASFLSVALLSALLAISARADVIGKARVIDGDTIEIAGQRVRLFGIDAPEGKQTCTKGGVEWRCGDNAAFALANIIGRHWVHCHEKDRDQYRRIVAVCNLAGPTGPDVNAMMVREGWALAFRRYSTDYVAAEAEAKAAKRGLWYGRASSWRRGSGGDDANRSGRIERLPARN